MCPCLVAPPSCSALFVRGYWAVSALVSWRDHWLSLPTQWASRCKFALLASAFPLSQETWCRCRVLFHSDPVTLSSANAYRSLHLDRCWLNSRNCSSQSLLASSSPPESFYEPRSTCLRDYPRGLCREWRSWPPDQNFTSPRNETLNGHWWRDFSYQSTYSCLSSSSLTPFCE